MPETSTAGIFQAAFIAKQMEQTPQAFFQTTFEPVGRVCAARHARGGLGCRENGEPISDTPKVGWVAKPNVFR
ncbi:hypothetical protein HMPREF3136_02920 [Neisseria sp. HMSC15C08]|nr:hypothetical protein HMPREF3136_02920 [Neisseria sp. HMSC15C08]